MNRHIASHVSPSRLIHLLTALCLALAQGCAAGDEVIEAPEAGPADVVEADDGLDGGSLDAGSPDASAVACRRTADCYGGDFCAAARECRSGVCVPLGTAANCDDGLACTLDACDAARGACTHQPLNAMCPEGRFCDTAAGCIPPPSCEAGDTPCQRLNHDPCRGVWSCDPVALRCVRSAAADCDDRNTCTVDSCSNEGTVARCVHDMPPNDCGAGQCGPSPSGCYMCPPCTSGDCVNGRCVGCPPCQVLAGSTCVPAMDGMACGSDMEVCTQDICLAGVCNHTRRIANDCGTRDCGLSPTGCFPCGTCGEGLFCQMGHCARCPDCQGWNGSACVPLSDGAECTPDASACTGDACRSGVCVHEPLANDCGTRRCGPSPSGCVAACGPACTAGPCVGGQCVPCPACQYFDGSRCVPVSNGISCPSDSNQCTQDVCMAGVCSHPAIANDCGARECGPSPSGCVPSCGPACTSGTCVAGRCTPCPECQQWSGVACVPVPSSAGCTPDSSACTQDVCAAGTCTHPPVANDCGTRACGPSPSGCFACGRACANGQVCSGGTCGCAAGTLCSGACVDTAASAAHCGGCGRACSTLQDCVAGVCVLSRCTPGETFCGGACFDLTRSNANCGACGRACPSGQACTGGVCACTSGTLCGGACVNTNSDNANCGGCGRSCPSGQYCSNGGCTCNSGSLCNGRCVNTSSDNANCGACGRSCPSGQYCAGGSCSCNSGALCSGSCVNTNSDSFNCGGCGRVCASGQYCSGGSCSCYSGTLCSGSCINTSSDFYNCGGCGRACGSGQYCSGGACYCSSGLLCSGRCVNTSSDPSHCGGCGRVCGFGQQCNSGSCASSLPDLTITGFSPPGTIGRGLVYAIPTTVNRTGGSVTSSGTVLVRIYLSRDSSWSSDDYRASLDYSSANFSSASLNSSGSLRQNVECAPGDIVLGTLSTGFYYWLAVVDPSLGGSGTHAESSETNNVFVGGTVTVY